MAKEKYTLANGQTLFITGTNLVLEKGDEIEFTRTETDPTKKVAEYLHKKMCCDNHDDRCWWYHENDWDGRVHQSWLQSTHKLIEFLHRKGMFRDSNIDIPLVEGLIDLFSSIG